MTAFSRKDGWYASVVVVVFLGMVLAAATGSTIAMIGAIVASAVAFTLMVVFAPRTQRRAGLLIALMGAIIGLAVLFVVFRIVPMDLLR